MISQLRALISALLCSMILLGHVPAWFHVASCDHHSHSSAVPHAHSECCGNHSSQSPDGLSNGSESTNGHSSEECAICQSLNNDTGRSCAVQNQLTVDSLCEPAAVFYFQSLAPVAKFVACPRGPPVSTDSAI